MIAARSLAVALLLAACSASPPPAPASAASPPTPATPSSVAPSPAPHRADCRADCRASLPSPADRRYADCLDALACDAIRTSLAAPAAPLRPGRLCYPVAYALSHPVAAA